MNDAIIRRRNVCMILMFGIDLLRFFEGVLHHSQPFDRIGQIFHGRTCRFCRFLYTGSRVRHRERLFCSLWEAASTLPSA